MPQFYFDTDDGGDLVPGETGVDLPSLNAARQQAQAALGKMAKDRLPDDERRTFSVTIRDEKLRPVMRVALELTTRRL
jgi:hypothetical protein